jgi:Susd and RagB outer membrane lipoprotein
MSASMESVLKGYADPRMPIYFLPSKTTGDYEGLRNGLTSADMAAPLNKADANSHHGDRWNSITGLETSSNVMATAEADFLKAEGALLGWNMGGTAKSHYEKGIRNSMLQWGITSDAVINAYINSTKTPIAPGDFLNSPPLTDVPVVFGATTDVQKEQITLQKWLALYPEGVEAWADIRRSGALKLYPVANSDNPDLPSTPANPATNWIRRIPFINDEKVSNEAAVRVAEETLLNGPDKITTPLWWDTH